MLALRPNKTVEEAVLRSMVKTIRHRGPDDSGVYINEEKTVGLGSARLAILDLSEQGHMPMTNADESVWIVYNGETYNCRELQKELEAKGYTFRSSSDTEVVLHAYEEYGVDCVKHLRGMFAFAIWDAKKKRLFGARDRLGKKPFKYFMGEDVFVLASELKAFIDLPEVPKEMDPGAIHDFLTYQYVPDPETGFKGVKKLPPAHTLVLDLSKDRPDLKIEPYWNLDYRHPLDLSEAEWGERIVSKLEEATQLRLLSDVPLGAFLSGGIDSSAVVGLMAQHSQDPVKTFSIGFKTQDERFNELPYAKMVAERFGTDHTEFVVEPNDLLSTIDDLVHSYEEPYADSSALPTYYVSKLTREHVTVALNGDGGDENFAGYPWYGADRVANFYYHFPRWMRRIPHALLTPLFRQIPRELFQRGAAFLEGGTYPRAQQYHYYLSYFTPHQKNKLYQDSFREMVGNRFSGDYLAGLYEKSLANHPLDRALSTDIHSFLANDLLPKVDIASMAVSLEARSPFLDHEFMEMCAQIPASLKWRGGGKYILKKALNDLLPHDILHKKKWGFRVPLRDWFQNDLKDFSNEHLLEGPFTKAFLNRPYVERLLKQHQTTSIGDGRQIWALLWLNLWYQTFFKS